MSRSERSSLLTQPRSPLPSSVVPQHTVTPCLCSLRLAGSSNHKPSGVSSPTEWCGRCQCERAGPLKTVSFPTKHIGHWA